MNMTREQALQAIKAKMDYYESDKRLRAAIETLVPELKESEDERVRKEIVGVIQKHYPNTPESYRWISWLEKQKEQSEEPKIAFGDWGDKGNKESIFNCLKYMRFIKKITNQEYDDLTKWLDSNLTYNLEIPEGDVTPEEDGSFNEDKFLERKLSAFLQNYDKEYDDDAAVSDVARHFYEIGKKQKEQKPIPISCNHENGTQAEWSEEDEEKLNNISEIIEHCTTIPYSGGTLTLNKAYKKELQCFIKSLRPSWKPSEEQMRCLDMVLCDEAMDDNVHRVLVQLSEQLKKLI